jgi:hypothetical protein
MIDTLYLGLSEEVPYGSLYVQQYNERFYPPSMPGWVGKLTGTEEGSYCYNNGAKLFVRLFDSVTGTNVSGPLRKRGSEHYWQCTNCRVNIPKLAGLPAGCLPTTDEELERALQALSYRLSWLPDGWLFRAKVKEVHLSMNFDFSAVRSAEEIFGAHALMRHPAVRRDPDRFMPHHGTLYWKGKNTVIALYNKTKELCEKASKHQKKPLAEVMCGRPQILRMEFRLKAPTLSPLLDRFFDDPASPQGAPPQKQSSSRVAVTALTAASLEWMFREMAMGFGNLPIRTPMRMTLTTFLAILIDKEVKVGPMPITEFAALVLKDRRIKDAKKLASTLNFGSPVFNWFAYLGTEGWGPYAVPYPSCFSDIGGAK